MNKIISWINHHQVISFFILTFAITWGLGFSYKAVIRQNQFLLGPLVFIATLGPGLAGIILTALVQPQTRQGSRKRYWLAFLAAWVVCVLVFTANNTFINHAPFSVMLMLWTAVCVLPVAFVVSMAFSRSIEMRKYLSSLVRIRGVRGWALLAAVFPPLLMLFSNLISKLLGRQSFIVMNIKEVGFSLIGLIIVKFLYQFFFFNATGEEAGWRGFALPRLQTRFNSLIAILVLALFWAPWHFFLWQAEGSPVLTTRFWLDEYYALIPATVFLVWFYNRSRGSILVAGIMHAAANTAFFFFKNLDFQVYNVVAVIVALVMIIADRMWRKPKNGNVGDSIS